MKRVLVLVNTLQNVTSFVYANHIEFFSKTAKTHPDVYFELFTPHRMSIDNARNSAAVMALRKDFDYLMFIDDDVLIPNDTFTKLLEADKDVIAGLVIIRGMPFNVMAFEFEDETRRQLVYFNKIPLQSPCAKEHLKYEAECEDCDKVELVTLAKCDAVGFSCCLIKTDILKPLKPPFFITGPNHTEDVYFCLKLRELEPVPEIYVHTGVQCGHLLNPEPIEFKVRKKLYGLYKKEWEEATRKPMRDVAHIERCLVSLGKSDELKESYAKA